MSRTNLIGAACVRKVLTTTFCAVQRQQEPAPKGFGEILGAAQNIVKDSQVQQSASWRPTEIQLQDEDYIHKQLVASPEGMEHPAAYWPWSSMPCSNNNMSILTTAAERPLSHWCY